MSLEIQTEQSGQAVTLRLSGQLELDEARQLHVELDALAGRDDVSEVVVDFQAIDALDSSGIAVVSLASSSYLEQGKRLHVEHLSEGHRQALAMMPAHAEGFGVVQDPPGTLESLGAWGFEAWEEVLAYLEFLTDLVARFGDIFTRGQRPPKGSITQQAVSIGVDALPIIALSSWLMGLVLGFQAADQLSEFGANVYVANLVGVSMAREFGPLMTGIILAGRSGSAIAAELGTMKVQEELDALRTMGLTPTRYLALPKMLAITVVGPSLTLMGIVLGIFGGLIIGVFYVDLSVTLYLSRTMDAIDPVDMWHGMWKSVIFAWIIGSIGCFCGLRIEGGASGVGRATTRAVVLGIFLLIVADAIASSLSTVAGGWL